MADTIFSSFDSTEKAPEKTSNLNVSQAASSQPCQMTVKRGFLALFIMYASQTVVGFGFSYVLRFIQGAGDGSGLTYSDLVRLFHLKLDYRKAFLKRINL